MPKQKDITTLFKKWVADNVVIEYSLTEYDALGFQEVESYQIFPKKEKFTTFDDLYNHWLKNIYKATN